MSPRQVGLAKQMVLRISDVKRIVDKCHALWMVERARIKSTVRSTKCTGANHLLQFTGKRRNNDPVVITIRNEQPAALFIGQNLARISQRRGRLLTRVNNHRSRRRLK